MTLKRDRLKILLACVAALGLVGGAYWLTQQQQADERLTRPLVPEHLAPREPDDIAWFFLRNRLVAAGDDPRAVAALLEALRAPAPQVLSETWSGRATISDAGVPFAIGLSSGQVLLVDENALWCRNETVRTLGSALARHRPAQIAFEPGSLTIVTSPRYRLEAEGMRVCAVWNARGRSWLSSRKVSGSTMERVRAALLQTRSIYLGEGAPVEPMGGERNTPWPGTRVHFTPRPPIVVVPTASWSSVLVLRQSQLNRGAKAAVAGPTIAPYAVLVEPEKHSCDQAIVIPCPDYADTASVWLRLTGTKRWFHAGIVPLRYP